ncbi:Transcription initiation factor TFIID subunit 2, partial [Neophaeococcomyces mojaviensis]
MEVDQPEPSPVVRTKHYQLINQKVNLEVDFDQRLKGITHLTIFPESPDIKAVVLNARQCHIEKVTINGLKPANIAYTDPCDTLTLHTNASVHQHHILQEKISKSLTSPPEPELVILLPEELKITENPQFVVQTADGVKATKLGSATGNDAETAEALADTQVSRYTRLEVMIQFSSIHTRDALHFATGAPGSGRWPHVYTRGGFTPGRASCIFPCMDSPYYRCTWEISITGPTTVGDALRQISGLSTQSEKLTEETRAYEAKEMVFVCPGDITDDVVDRSNSTKRTVSYAISQNVAAHHIGFAIGPFDKVDLATFRDADKLELLQENAAPIMAYCLPGRRLETENTCLPVTDALDHFVISYAPYPFNSFSYCFVDDHLDSPASFAGLAVCSSRMLYPDNVIDPAQEVTRTLIQAMTTQWLGVQIIPRQAEDTWVVLGSALFIAELFMKDLCGNNEYRFRMKKMADRICKLDYQRPSLWDMGALLHVDRAEYEFLALKSPIVLYILDRRIAKTIGSAKIGINIGKFMSKARNEDLKDNLLSTQDFCRMTEKALHSNIDDFVNQWVKGAGCPRFVASQKFNKKKLVIEMTIRQVQANTVNEHDLDPETFMRDVREEFHNVYAATPQHVFTGPMTIRIHEADGTPYEHIIHIKEAVTKVEVPYNTKYKRLKRSKKQRARNAAARGDNEDDNDALVYCLGDVLQDDEEIEAWKIME